MMLRVQRERMSGGYFPSAREYTVGYGLTRERLARCSSPDAADLPPRPDEPRPRDRRRRRRRRPVRWCSTRSRPGSRCGCPCSTTCSPERGAAAVSAAARHRAPPGRRRRHGQRGDLYVATAWSPRSATSTPHGRRADRRRRAGRAARASSTCTPTCASRAARTPRRSPPARGPRRVGGFTAVLAMANTIAGHRHRRGGRARPRPRPRGRPGRRTAGRRGHQGPRPATSWPSSG